MVGIFVVLEQHVGFEEFHWLYVGESSSTTNNHGNWELGFRLVAIQRVKRDA